MTTEQSASTMTFDEIEAAFNRSVLSEEVGRLWTRLNTLRRPKKPDFEEGFYYDWVLVRPAGVELGFVDDAYHFGEDNFRWGHGELILVQAYFYSPFKDIKQYRGTLPQGLTFSDTRAQVREKLAAFEASRRSYRTDTWDVDGYRLTVTYTPDGNGIDRLLCRVLPVPLATDGDVRPPALDALIPHFGTELSDPVWTSLWPAADMPERLAEAVEDSELDFLDVYGATLSFSGEGRKSYLRSITLHRNRDRDSVGWQGRLPEGLSFEDSPQDLRDKMAVAHDAGSDAPDTGFALWHRPDYTLHVLYSNIDNRLIRVRLIAPGVWRSVFDEEMNALLAAAAPESE